MRHTLLITVVLVALAALGQGTTYRTKAQEDTGNSERLSIATKEIEPFVFVSGEEVSGFSIDLWEALALEAGLDFDYEIVTTVQDQLAAVETGSADGAIAAISITEAREERVDFSHSYFRAGLGIMTLRSSANLRDTLGSAFSPNLLRLFALLVLSIVLAGHVIWIIERRRNPEFPQSYPSGVLEGIWWAAVTVTTVGYGDKTPIGRLGRLFGIVWMFAGLFIIASFTAGVTSQLTLQQLEGAISGPDDLPGHTIATVSGSTAEEWLMAQNLRHMSTTTIEDAYELLDDGIALAIVYDRPVLLYYALQNEEKGYLLPGETFSTEEYGIAFPTNSPLREEVNRALLRLIENGTYERIYNRWYGHESGI